MRQLLIVCTVVTWLSGASILASAAEPLPTGGINPSPYAYWEQSFPLVDVAKMDWKWRSTDGDVWSDNREIQLDELGYPAVLQPGQVARALIFTHNGSMYPTGPYRLSWEGTGEVVLNDVGHGSTVHLVEQLDRTAIYDVVQTVGGGLLLDIRATDPNDPVQNISVIPLEFENAPTRFHPRYLDDLTGYGVMRFMDWNSTNGPWHETWQPSSWSERTQLQSALWGHHSGHREENGRHHTIPYEVQIELSNVMQQDVWLTVPHAADDDYVRNLAQLVEQQLDPNLRVWVEYTNEAWNSIFPQYDYVQNELTARYGVGANAAYALRASEIFDYFKDYLPEDRLVRVLSGWSAVPNVLRHGLEAISDEGGPNADVAAVTAYFRLTNDEMADLYNDYLAGNVDTDQVFSDLRAYIDRFADNNWKQNQQVASDFGLPLVAYEGGQGMTPNWQQRDDEGFVELLASFQRDPRMGELYDYLTERWQALGGSTLVFFNNLDNWSKSGFWGLREDFYQTDSFKYDAVKRHLAEFPGGYDAQTGRLRGDLNGNAVLDADDMDLLSVAVRTDIFDPLYDLNQDGELSSDDRQYWLRQLKRSALGDSNLDHSFDSADLLLVFQAGEYEDGIPQNSTWATGDSDGNGDFDSSDLVVVLQEGTYEQGPLNTSTLGIPEPSGLLLAALAAGWTALIRGNLFGSCRGKKRIHRRAAE